jgi:molybdopterin-guanine dinucleotide biosynthesis protein A
MEITKDFHDFQVSFCGHSGVGKTTLIEKIIKHLAPKYSIGYVKSDAHKFDIDHEGKDTYIAKTAGAERILITSETQYAFIGDGKCDEKIKNQFIDCDFVLIEGFKKSLSQKIVFMEIGDEIHSRFMNDEYENVVAIISNSMKSETLEVFNRNQIEGIAQFVVDLHKSKYQKRPLNALILSGGYSTRMQKDKGRLEYHGMTQVQYLNDLLLKYCDNVFHSCRAEQSAEEHLKKYSQIHDKYLGFGPTGGILSAFSKDSEAAWLVVACDLPFLNESTIEKLINNRNHLKVATCFENPLKKWPEPLCTIYEPKAKLMLGYSLSIGKPCPRKVLFNSSIELIKLDNPEALDNANTNEQYQEIYKSLNKESERRI